jgi:hypothetical protein
MHEPQQMPECPIQYPRRRLTDRDPKQQEFEQGLYVR